MARQLRSPRAYAAQNTTPFGELNLAPAGQDLIAQYAQHRAEFQESAQQRIDEARAREEAARAIQAVPAASGFGVGGRDLGREAAMKQLHTASQIAGKSDVVKQARDSMQAIIQGARSGLFNESQVQSAMESWGKEYGEHMLFEIPEAAEFAGLSEQFEANRAAKIAAFAKQYTGGNERYVRWDDENGAPAYNFHALSFEKEMAEKDAAQAKPQLDYARTLFNMLAPQKPRESDFMVLDMLNKQAFDEANTNYVQFVKQFLPQTQAIDAAERAAVEQQFFGAQQPAPQPSAQPMKRGFMNDRPISEAEAIARVKTDPSQAGYYKVIINGRATVRKIVP